MLNIVIFCYSVIVKPSLKCLFSVMWKALVSKVAKEFFMLQISESHS